VESSASFGVKVVPVVTGVEMEESLAQGEQLIGLEGASWENQRTEHKNQKHLRD
jgi:hypothetical protein